MPLSQIQQDDAIKARARGSRPRGQIDISEHKPADIDEPVLTSPAKKTSQTDTLSLQGISDDAIKQRESAALNMSSNMASIRLSQALKETEALTTAGAESLTMTMNSGSIAAASSSIRSSASSGHDYNGQVARDLETKQRARQSRRARSSAAAPRVGAVLVSGTDSMSVEETQPPPLVGQTSGAGLEYVLTNEKGRETTVKESARGRMEDIESRIRRKTAGYLDEESFQKQESQSTVVPMPSLVRGGGPETRPGAQNVNIAGIPMGDSNDDSIMESGEEGTGFNTNNGANPEIAAELIDAETDRERLKETLQDVLQTQDAVQVVDLEAEDRLKRARQRRNLCIYLVVALVIGAAVISAVVVSINNNSAVAPTESPTMSPTASPTSRFSAVYEAVVDEFGEIPEDPNSPQQLAVAWLTDEDTTIRFPLEESDDDELGSKDQFLDRYVTAVLAYSTQFENWFDNTNWLNPDLPICEWQGLTCNDEGRLAIMDLSVQNLQGQIPSEIGFLDSMDFVYLFRNQLTGTIPPEMGNLDDVDFMYLNENKLSGSIPEEMAGLLDADELFLFDNELTGTIPESFGGLVDLINLYMYGNQLSGTIPGSLGALKRLERLYLYDNQLSGAIPSRLSEIISLQRLQLQNNQLSGTVPNELGDFLGLAVMTIQGNRLTGTMPDPVCKLTERGAIDSLMVLEADCAQNGTIACSCCSSCF